MRINNRALLWPIALPHWPIALRVNARYTYVRNIVICAKLIIYSTTAKFSAQKSSHAPTIY